MREVVLLAPGLTWRRNESPNPTRQISLILDWSRKDVGRRAEIDLGVVRKYLEEGIIDPPVQKESPSIPPPTRGTVGKTVLELTVLCVVVDVDVDLC